MTSYFCCPSRSVAGWSVLASLRSIRAATDDPSMTALLSDVFSAAGPLASTVPGYRLRAQQLELAERIAAAMAGNQVLIAEAGTGTGKTYAYLVPALLSGGKVIVSTGTRNLQDQLFTRDIPTIRKALKSPLKVALLKGRANYLCHYHLERSLSDGRFLSRDDARLRAAYRALCQEDT